MCKINGHSIFSYIAQPWNGKRLASSKKREQEITKAQQEVAIAQETRDKATSESELNQSTAKSVQTKKATKRDLSSLKVPLATSQTGASIGGASGLGLNLGG